MLQSKLLTREPKKEHRFGESVDPTADLIFEKLQEKIVDGKAQLDVEKLAGYRPPNE